MSDPIRQPMQILRAASRVMARRLAAMRIKLVILELVGVLLGAGSGITTGSFLVAETPAEAARAARPPMPPAWEAGVFNHGSYYRWYTIKLHPFLFSLSLLGLAGGVCIIGFVHMKHGWNPFSNPLSGLSHEERYRILRGPSPDYEKVRGTYEQNNE